MWLAVDNVETLDALNASYQDRMIAPVAGSLGGLLVNADLLSDCGPGGYWEHWAYWLRGLQPTDEQPAPAPDQTA